MLPVRGTSATGAAAVAGAARGRVGVEGLAFSVPETAARAGVGVGAAGGIDAAALLALQSAEDATDPAAGRRRDRQARADGQALLQTLGVVQRGLLGGAIDPGALGRLAVLTDDRAEAADPRLRQILAEIRLRARIELARHESD